MDIRQWLQNTVDREPPNERIETGFPAFLQPKQDTVRLRQRTRRKRRRTSSYSSGNAHRPSAQSSSSDQTRVGERGAEAASLQSSSSSSSGSRRSTVSDRRETPIETFHRRSRYKTKPDRYESKQKRRKKDQKTRQQRKPESRRRKSHRSGDGTRTAGLVQSFQLKNGPKNQRLTLRPDASAGIFKNGRASGPIATSAPGLPDLVFNEMKFLRRPKEHQDELSINDAKKQSKKTQKQVQEEEISAYFNKNIPPDEQTGRMKQKAAGPRTTGHSAQQRPTEPGLGPPQHHVNLSEKAFLGFGSRGPPQDGIESQQPSYYTWSESPGKPSPQRSRPTVPAFEATYDHRERRHSRTSQVPNTPLPMLKVGPAMLHRSQSVATAGQWVESGRAKGPALVELYKPSMATARHTSLVESLVKDVSEPLPGVKYAANEARSDEVVGRRETSNYHTSDILNIRGSIIRAGRSPSPPGRGLVNEALMDKENENPITSTPTSERLRHAFGTVAKPETWVGKEIQRSPGQSREGKRSTSVKAACPQRNRSYLHVEVVPSPPRWEMPQRGFSRTSDANRLQQRPVSRPVSSARIQPTGQRQPRSREAIQSMRGSNDEHEDKMLDVLPGAPWIRPLQHFARANSREAAALVRDLATYDDGRIVYHADADVVESVLEEHEYKQPERRMEAEEVLEPTSFEQDLLSIHSFEMGDQLSGGQFESEYCSVGRFQDQWELGADNSHREEADVGLPGFWRPNVLY